MLYNRKSWAWGIWVLIVSIYPAIAQKNENLELGIIPKEAIWNPERGFHLESNYFVHNLQNPFHPISYPQGWIDELNERYGSTTDKLTSLQLYLYLTAYVGKDIPSDAFDTMQKLFDAVKNKGYKMVLRFAYDTDYGSTNANFNDVFRHLDQLEPFIKKNIGLIDIWQMGFIGAWGEGHSSVMTKDYVNRSKMVKRILDIFEDRQTTVRYPVEKDKFTLAPHYMKRMGYNNDYFTASEHPLAPENDYVFGTSAYDQVKAESPYVKVIGEIPYAENTEWGLHKIISVPNTLKALRDHHYSLFDITQNNELNIKHWRTYRLTPQLLDSLQLLYDVSYFEHDGKKVGRSAYDYIRDHLGYRFYIDNSSTKLIKKGKSLHYDIAIKNVGFSTLHNPRPMFLVLIDDNNRIISTEKLEVDPRSWQPYDKIGESLKPLLHKVKGEVSVHSKGIIKVGLWLPDPDPALQYIEPYAIQFANENMEVWKGGNKSYRVNIIGIKEFN